MKASKGFRAVVVFLLLCASLAPAIATAKPPAHRHKRIGNAHPARRHRGHSVGRGERAARPVALRQHRAHTGKIGSGSGIGGASEAGVGGRMAVTTAGGRSAGGESRSPIPKGQTPPSSPPPTSPPPTTSQPEGKVIFEGNFDGSFAGWYVQSLPYRATISTAHPYSGSGAGRFEVQPGDVEPDTGSQRSEVVGPTFHEGENIYVRDAIRVPVGYTFQGSWQLIDQLHEKPWSGSPGIATFLDPNRRISFGAGDGSPMYWRGPQLESERWYDLVYRVDLSRNPSVGFVELWLDGVQQTLANGQARMYGETIQTAETYLKAGIYRSLSSSGISIVEHDNVVVGTSLAAVMSA